MVEPPIACSTVRALRNAAAVMISLGRGPWALAISAASRPEASATRRRSEWVAGIEPLPGRPMPSVSTMQPMVLAVPITMQVPLVGARRSLTCSMSDSSRSRRPLASVTLLLSSLRRETMIFWRSSSETACFSSL